MRSELFSPDGTTDGTPNGTPDGTRSDLRPLIAVSVSGLAAASLVPFLRPGLNIVLVGTVTLVAIIFSGAVGKTPTRLALAFASLGSLFPFALLDAEWVVALDLAAAILFAAAASVDASRWSDIRSIPLRFLRAIFKAPSFILVPASAAMARIAPENVRTAIKAAVLSVGLLLIFGALFISADSVLANAFDGLIPSLKADRVFIRAMMFAFVSAGVATIIFVSAEPKSPSHPRETSSLLGATEWKVALSVLTALFVVFVGVQLTVLFAGRSHVLTTAGLTYAEYARQGFFQLIFASILTLGVIAAASRSVLDGSMIRFHLGGLCVLTVVILASALKRLLLYESAFGFTRARFFAHACILALGAIFIALVVAGLMKRYGWLPRGILAIAAISVLGFNIANPDRLIAKWNIDRYGSDDKFDLEYLSTLSADSASEMERLPPRMRVPWLDKNQRRLCEKSKPLEWNLSRLRARDQFGDELSMYKFPPDPLNSSAFSASPAASASSTSISCLAAYSRTS